MVNLGLNEHGGRAAAMRIRVCTVIACASIMGPGVLVALLAAGLAKGVAIGGTAALVLVGALLARGLLPTSLAGAGNGHRVLFALFLLLSGATAYRLGHMSV